MREEVEEIIGKCFPVGSDGFLMLVDVMGSDEDIEQAARISYGEGTRPVSKTRGLLRYLMRHKHTTPFEMVEMKFCVRIPMHIWRQWIRHRTANVNEYSTRYSVAIDSMETTNPDEWRLQASNNKQGSSGYLEEWPDKSITGYETPGKLLSEVEYEHHKDIKNLYATRLALGVAREQARKDLPLSTYTQAYWKCDLHNIFHFLKLRCDSHAQKEIRDYANVMAGMVKRVAPLAFDAWVDYSFGASNWTLLDKKLLRTIDNEYGMDDTGLLRFLSNNLDNEETIGPEIKKIATDIGMSNREFDEFWQKLEIPEIPDFDLDLTKVEDFSKWRNNS